MKRKKWSEDEEKTLITKYSELVRTGTLPKLKTREKKFKPIADHVNAAHNAVSPLTFPFRWSWRDVSVKIQNMRHQYLGVKQKIRVCDNEFDWGEGNYHWQNFSLYREKCVKQLNLGLEAGKCPNVLLVKVQSVPNILVFGDVELEEKDGDRESGSDEELGIEVLRLQEMALKREERRREREEEREGKRMREVAIWDNDLEDLDMEMERHKRELERRSRMEWESEEEQRRRREAEERWEVEEIAWKERVVRMQVEHEKQMMQIQAEACHNQMQIIGAMARLLCQFFGPTSDGLGGSLGALPPQVLGDHPDGLGGDGKPDSNSPSDFL